MTKKDIYDGAPWTEVAEQDLRDALDYGHTIEEAAGYLCRSGTVDDVRRKAKELGLIPRLTMRWQNTRPRKRLHRAPAAFIDPCIPTKVDKPPIGDRWAHEIKHDGFRIIARKVGRDVRLFTKQGNDYSKRYPLVVEAINRLRVSSIVLDGEAVYVGANGLPDFDALWNRTNDEAVLFFAFDVLELEGEDLRPRPLLERKRQLYKVLTKNRTGLRFVKHLAGDGSVIFEHACKLGLEGIVSKRIDLPYEPGPSKAWQKMKNKEHPAMQRVREAFEREREAARMQARSTRGNMGQLRAHRGRCAGLGANAARS